MQTHGCLQFMRLDAVKADWACSYSSSYADAYNDSGKLLDRT